jgi:hypothetical protein
MTKDNEISANQMQARMLLERYEAARKRRDYWLRLWQDCYDYALPQNAGFADRLRPGKHATRRFMMRRLWMRRINWRRVCLGI